MSATIHHLDVDRDDSGEFTFCPVHAVHGLAVEHPDCDEVDMVPAPTDSDALVWLSDTLEAAEALRAAIWAGELGKAHELLLDIQGLLHDERRR